jgi:hypothetical protein
MRYVLYAILFYILYLFLKFFFRKLIDIYSYKGKSKNNSSGNIHEMYKKKKDLSSIEDAEFEEIK